MELVILFAHFLTSTGQDQAAFPWKHYLFISFIAPVVMVVVVGLIIVGFNFFIFGDKDKQSSDDGSLFDDNSGKKIFNSSRYLFSISGQIPVLAGLLILCMGALFLYKLDVIVEM